MIGVGLGMTRRGGGALLVTGATDNFDRANAATLGNAQSGQPWTDIRGQWGVTSNFAICQTPLADHNITVVETLLANCVVNLALSASASGGPGLVFRFVDVNNYLYCWAVTNLHVGKVVAGVDTELANVAAGLSSVWSPRATLSGTSVIISDGGGAAISTLVVPEFATATKHGLFGAASPTTSTRYNNFSVA
jgi:hypothetical protein